MKDSVLHFSCCLNLADCYLLSCNPDSAVLLDYNSSLSYLGELFPLQPAQLHRSDSLLQFHSCRPLPLEYASLHKASPTRLNPCGGVTLSACVPSNAPASVCCLKGGGAPLHLEKLLSVSSLKNVCAIASLDGNDGQTHGLEPGFLSMPSESRLNDSGSLVSPIHLLSDLLPSVCSLNDDG